MIFKFPILTQLLQFFSSGHLLIKKIDFIGDDNLILSFCIKNIMENVFYLNYFRQ